MKNGKIPKNERAKKQRLEGRSLRAAVVLCGQEMVPSGEQVRVSVRDLTVLPDLK